MKTMMTVNDVISFFKHGEHRHVTLITACSNNIIYSNFYDNYPDEFKELDVAQIEFQDGTIILYIL